MRQSRGDRIVYVANDAYWGGAPKIRHLSVAEVPDATTQSLELRHGTLDYAPMESSQFAQLRRDPSLVSAITPINDFVAYALNVERPITSDVGVRRAISMAIDRVALVARVCRSTRIFVDLARTEESLRVRSAAANALLERDGWHRGPDAMRAKDGRRLHLVSIDFSGSVPGRNIDTQTQQMLAAVGIEMKLKYYSPSLRRFLLVTATL